MRSRTTSLLASASVAAVALLSLSACGGGGDEIKVGYFQSATIGPEALIAGNKDLAAKIDDTIKLIPIDSGVAGLAELRGGAFQFVSGVGNPPVVGAISADTKFKVVYAEYYDAAQLIVPSSFTSNSQLAGKTVGALQGSSEDFEIRGWLKTQKLDDKVKVVGFPSEAAIAAAYKAKKIDAGYVEIAQALDLKQNAGGKQVVTAQQIADLGYPSLNILGVTDKFAKAEPKVVQQFVCQTMHAQAISSGSKADTYIKRAAPTVGAKPAEAVPATKVLPFVSAADELKLFTSGSIAKSYALTGQFLVDQGRVKTAPSDAQIAAHLDSSYVEQAVKDGCDK